MDLGLGGARQGGSTAAADDAAATLQVAEITDRAALEALRPEWAALYDLCPGASPFQSPAWLLAWTRHLLADGLWTLAVRRAGRLVGVAPLFVYRDPAGGGRQLTLLGNGASDRLDLLALPGERDEIARAVLAHIAASPIWTECDFRDLPAEAGLLQAPFPGVARETIEREPPCPALDLPDRPEQVLERLPTSRRGDLRRCARRLAERAPLRFERADQGARAEHLAALIRLHGARWRQRGAAEMLADPAVQAFHAEATAGLLAGGELRLEVLRLGDRIIAAHYGLRRGARGYSYLHAFDPAFAALGPGWVLMARSLQTAVADGVRRFDFLRGREPYKYAWGGADQPQFRRRIAR